MPNREVRSNITYAQLRKPANLEATGSSNYVDLRGYDAVDLIVDFGDVTAAGGANNFVITVEEKDTAPATAAGYATVAATDLVGTFPTLENGVTGTVAAVGYRGSKRYVRVTMTETGTAAAVIGVVAALHLSTREPARALSVTTGAAS